MRWVHRAATLLGICLLLALITEAVLRASGWRPPVSFFVVDDRVGRRLIAGSDTTAWGARVVIDERGLRVPPTPRAAAPDSARALFLGGSCTFGYGLAWHDTYPERLAAEMAARDRPIEVVNGGVPLGDSSNRLAFLHELGDQLAPDLIVFSEAVNELAATMGSSHQCFRDGALTIHFVAPEEEIWPIVDGELDDRPASALRIRDWSHALYNHAGWLVLGNGVPTARSWIKSNAPFSWLYRRSPRRYQRLLQLDPEGSRHGYELYRQNLRAMVEWARAREVAIVFMTQPRRGQQDLFELLPDDLGATVETAASAIIDGRPGAAIELLEPAVQAAPAFVTPRYDLALALLSAGRADEAAELAEPVAHVRTYAHLLLMAEVAAELSVPLARPDLVFQSRRSEGLFLGDGMHPNARGNRLIAAELARTLERADLPDATRAATVSHD